MVYPEKIRVRSAHPKGWKEMLLWEIFPASMAGGCNHGEKQALCFYMLTS